MITIHPDCEKKLQREPTSYLFKHRDLYCLVYRLNWSGNLNGYVAVPKSHPFYGKSYRDRVKIKSLDKIVFNGNYIGLLCAIDPEKQNELSLDLAIEVHGGLTYADDGMQAIGENALGDLWWFGFDTAHCDDLKPYQSEIDKEFAFRHNTDTYRDFDYVKLQTIHLAEQLALLRNFNIGWWKFYKLWFKNNKDLAIFSHVLGGMIGLHGYLNGMNGLLLTAFNMTAAVTFAVIAVLFIVGFKFIGKEIINSLCNDR